MSLTGKIVPTKKVQQGMQKDVKPLDYLPFDVKQALF